MTTGGLGRRAFLRRSAQAAVAFGSSGALLAACGDSGSGDGAGAAGDDVGRRPHRRRCRRKMRRSRGSCRATSRRSPTRSRPPTSTYAGAIPEELSGLYVRNGSNPLPGYSPHWFFGDGMVHGVRLDERQGGLVPQPLRAHRAARGRRRARSAGRTGRRVDLSNVSVIHHAGKLLTLGEVGLPYELAPHDLLDGRAVRLRRQASPATSPRTRRSIPRRATCTSSATGSPRRSSRTTSPTRTARWSSAGRRRRRRVDR